MDQGCFEMDTFDSQILLAHWDKGCHQVVPEVKG